MKMKSARIAGSLLFLTGTLACQVAMAQVAPNIPTFKPRTPARWTITYQDRGAKPAPTPKSDTMDPNMDAKKRRVVKEVYEMEGKTARVVKTFSDGSTDQIYVIDGVSFVLNPDSKQVMAEAMGHFSAGSLRFGEHYPGFEWLKKQYYVDEQQLGDHKCWHFRQEPPASKNGRTDANDVGAGLVYDPNFTSVEREAWVDEETQLPYAFRQGPVTAMYEHQTPSGEKITPSGEFLKAIKLYNGTE